jgi:phosphoribosylamine--glycine ligase
MSRAAELTIGVIGKDGRTSAIQRALQADNRVKDVVVLSTAKEKSGAQLFEAVSAAVERHRPDFVVVSPEAPLALGVVDHLWLQHKIPSVGPTKRLACLESSKAFTRTLIAKHRIPGNPRHRVFKTIDGIDAYLREIREFVVKPDGLTGGKGVKVWGDHLQSIDEAIDYCKELLSVPDAQVIIEEKLDGEEFSLQSFCDGKHVVHMPLVQDHKRAYDGDTGPNTGGMGSYSCADLSLPFVTPDVVAAARDINARMPRALFEETGEPYKGMLFGGFMATKDGVRLLEYNARFGDPESLNVLSILETSFVDICQAIIDGSLDRLPVTFRRAATVCKYIVPEGYPNKPVTGAVVDLSHVPKESESLRIYPAAVEPAAGGSSGSSDSSDRLVMTGSRAIAFVGIADTLADAEAIAERAVTAVQGPVFHRKDIGTSALVQKRVDHMHALRGDAARFSKPNN